MMLPDGTACSNGLVCGGEEICVAGVCADQPDPRCDDGNACTVGAYRKPNGCVAARIVGCCDVDCDCADDGDCDGVDDGDGSTAERCSEPGDTCSSTPISGCLETDDDCDDGDACTIDVCGSDDRCASTANPMCADGSVSSDAGGRHEASVGAEDASGVHAGVRHGSTTGGVDRCHVPTRRASHSLAIGLAVTQALVRERRRRCR
jgi:hypothetical protein